MKKKPVKPVDLKFSDQGQQEDLDYILTLIRNGQHIGGRAHFGIKQYPDLESVDKWHQALLAYQKSNNIIWGDMTVLGYKAE